MIRTAKRIVWLVVIAAVLFVLGVVLTPGEQPRSLPGAPTLRQVRQLARLVTLHVPISDIQTTTLEGYTGGVAVTIAVHGDVELGVDLDRARFESVDEQRRCAVLVLPLPTPSRARLDHERTRVTAIDRSGMWTLKPGQAKEDKLITQALAKAQQTLEQAARDTDLRGKARTHAERVLAEFFHKSGWTVTTRWAE